MKRSIVTFLSAVLLIACATVVNLRAQTDPVSDQQGTELTPQEGRRIARNDTSDFPAVSAEFNGNGLSALHVEDHRQGKSVLQRSSFNVKRVQMASEYRNKNELHEIPYEKHTPRGPYSGREPTFSKGSTDPDSSQFHPDARRLTRTFDWGGSTSRTERRGTA